MPAFLLAGQNAGQIGFARKGFQVLASMKKHAHKTVTIQVSRNVKIYSTLNRGKTSYDITWYDALNRRHKVSRNNREVTEAETRKIAESLRDGHLNKILMRLPPVLITYPRD